MPLISKNAEFAEIHRYNQSKKYVKEKAVTNRVKLQADSGILVILSKGITYDPVELISDIQRPQEMLAE